MLGQGRDALAGAAAGTRAQVGALAPYASMLAAPLS